MKKVRLVKRKTENGNSKGQKNKAGYTVNTSCGRVGRGGNARFHTFQLDHHDGPTNGPTDGRTYRRTDKASYRVACPQLKSKILFSLLYYHSFKYMHSDPDCNGVHERRRTIGQDRASAIFLGARGFGRVGSAYENCGLFAF